MSWKKRIKKLTEKDTGKNSLLKKQSMLNTTFIGIITGLVVGTVLDRTVKLDVLVTIGIAVASALVVGGVAYLVLKPSTKLDETKETQAQKDVPVWEC